MGGNTNQAVAGLPIRKEVQTEWHLCTRGTLALRILLGFAGNVLSLGWLSTYAGGDGDVRPCVGQHRSIQKPHPTCEIVKSIMKTGIKANIGNVYIRNDIYRID